MGHEVNINEKSLEPVTAYWTAIARKEGFPIGSPVEYDSRQYWHQLPGAMMANLRRQLSEVGYEDRMEEVLDETGRVRVDLGYPIMITPLSQFVGTQAAMNVIAGERYKEVSDQVILYALGRYGHEAVTAMDQEVRAKILDRPRAATIGAERPPDLSIEELRQMYGGSSVSDEELMFRIQVDQEMRKKLRPPVEYSAGDSAVVTLMEALMRAGEYRHIHLSRPGLTVTMGRRQSDSSP